MRTVCMAALAALSFGGSALAMGNPSSIYCAEQGGTEMLVETRDGQMGVCSLPDGRNVESWAYFYAKGGAITPRDDTDKAAARHCQLIGGFVTVSEEGDYDLCNLPSAEAGGEAQQFVALDLYRRDMTEYNTGEPMAGPAAERCAEQGGERHVFRQLDWEIGVCKLPSGELVEEWDLLRRTGGY